MCICICSITFPGGRGAAAREAHWPLFSGSGFARLIGPADTFLGSGGCIGKESGKWEGEPSIYIYVCVCVCMCKAEG